MNRYYLPCSRRFNILCVDDFAGTKDLASWRQKLMTGWKDVSVAELVSGYGTDMPVGGKLEITARVKLGALSPEDVTVDAYYGRLDSQGDFAERGTVALEVKDSEDGVYTFQGHIPCTETGRFGYTVRIMPSQKRLENCFVMGLVTWA